MISRLVILRTASHHGGTGSIPAQFMWWLGEQSGIFSGQSGRPTVVTEYFDFPFSTGIPPLLLVHLSVSY